MSRYVYILIGSVCTVAMMRLAKPENFGWVLLFGLGNIVAWGFYGRALARTLLRDTLQEALRDSDDEGQVE